MSPPSDDRVPSFLPSATGQSIAIGLPSKDRRAAQLPERPSSACSSSTLRGDLRTSAPGGLSPGRIRIGNLCLSACRSSCSSTRPDGQAIAADTSSNMPVRVGQQRLRLYLGKLCPLFTFSTRQDGCTAIREATDEPLAISEPRSNRRAQTLSSPPLSARECGGPSITAGA